MSWFMDVLRFHHKFGQAVAKGFDNKTIRWRRKLIHEEYSEVMDGMRNLIYWNTRLRAASGSAYLQHKQEVAAKELCAELVDLLYVTTGSFVEFGVNPQPIWAAIQAANMRKEVNPEGGKPIKGEGWQKARVELKSLAGVAPLTADSSRSRAATPSMAVGPAEMLDDAIGKLSERSRERGFRTGTDTTLPQPGSRDGTRCFVHQRPNCSDGYHC